MTADQQHHLHRPRQSRSVVVTERLSSLLSLSLSLLLVVTALCMRDGGVDADVLNPDEYRQLVADVKQDMNAAIDCPPAQGLCRCAVSSRALSN